MVVFEIVYVCNDNDVAHTGFKKFVDCNLFFSKEKANDFCYSLNNNKKSGDYKVMERTVI